MHEWIFFLVAVEIYLWIMNELKFQKKKTQMCSFTLTLLLLCCCAVILYSIFSGNCLCSAVWSNAIPTSLRAKHQSYRAWLLNSRHGLTKTHINGYNSMMWFHALVGGFVSLQVLTCSAKLAFYFDLMDDASSFCETVKFEEVVVFKWIKMDHFELLCCLFWN